jgi:uncharacterized membrane protein YebE (DUF533 family)
MLSIFVFGVIGVCACTGIGYLVYKNKNKGNENKTVETVSEKEAEVESMKISLKPGIIGDLAE